MELKNILWYILPFLVRNIIPLISLPFFTRYLSPEEYGVLALSVIYGLFIVGVLNLGLISAFERNYFKLKSTKERLELMWTCIIFVFINLTVGVILTFHFEESLNKLLFGKKLPTYLTLLAIIHLSFKSILQYFYIYLRNAKKANYYSAISISEAVLCVFMSVYFVLNQYGILGYILGQAAGVIILFISVIFVFLFNNKIYFKLRLLKENLALSLPLTPRIFFGTINTQFDRYMLGLLNSSAAVGLFDIAQKIANTGFLFMTVLQQAYSPEVFSTYMDKPKQFSNHVGRFLAPYFYVSLLFCLFLGVFAQEIIYLLTTPSYYDAYPIVVILNMLYATYFFGKQPQLLLAKKTKLISFFSFMSLGLNILINFPLIKYYGILGAAWGTFITGIIVALISFYYSQKYAKINYSIYIYKIYLYFLTSMFGIFLMWFFQFNYISEVIIKIVILSGYFWLGYKFNFINYKDFHKIFKV